MPYKPLVGDVLRLRVVCYTSNQISVNTCHFKVSAVAGMGQNDLFIAQWYDALLAPRFATILSVGARYRGCSIQKIFPLPPKVPQISVAGDTVGTVAGDMLAGQVAGLIWARTFDAGKSERGRAYMPFPGEASNAATGVPIAAYVTALDDIAEEFYTTSTPGAGGDTISLKPVVWHRGTLSTSDIDVYGSRNVWATQRRRGGYGRMNLPPF